MIARCSGTTTYVHTPLFLSLTISKFIRCKLHLGIPQCFSFLIRFTIFGPDLFLSQDLTFLDMAHDGMDGMERNDVFTLARYIDGETDFCST